MKILIVDDERLTRVSLADFLQEGRAQGYRFISDPDSRSAAAFRSHFPY